MESQVLIQFLNTDDQPITDPIQVSSNMTSEHLFQIVPDFTETASLFVHGCQIVGTLGECIKSMNLSQENTIPIKLVKEMPKSKPAIFCNSSYSGHEQAVLKVKIHGSKCFTSGGDGTVRVWNMVTKLQDKIVKVSDHWVGCLDVCEDFLISGCMSGNLSIIKINDNYEIKNIKNHDNKGISSVKIGKIGNEILIISGGRDGKVNIYGKEGNFISSFSHQGPIDDIKIDNGLIYTAGRDMKIKIHAGSTEKDKIRFVKEIKSLTKRINCMEIRGNILATACDDFKVHIYSIKDNYKPLRQFIHKNIVTSLAFSENNLHIASCGFDKTVRIWDINSGRQVFSYFHVAAVYKVIFDSNLVISISKDKTVKTFCIKRKKIISDLVCGDEIFDVCYKNGQMVCGCRDKKVYFFA